MKFEFYNPNPKVRYKDGKPMKWHKGDCTTRALAKALDCTWKEAFQKQCEKAMELCDETNAKEVYESILLEDGFKKGVISQEFIKRNHHRPTVNKLIDDFYNGKGKHKLVIKCTHHLVASEGDTLYDVWNSGGETVWSFWYK